MKDLWAAYCSVLSRSLNSLLRFSELCGETLWLTKVRGPAPGRAARPPPVPCSPCRTPAPAAGTLTLSPRASRSFLRFFLRANFSCGQRDSAPLARPARPGPPPSPGNCPPHLPLLLLPAKEHEVPPLLVLDLGHAEGGREEHPLRGGRAGAIPRHGAAALTRHGAAAAGRGRPLTLGLCPAGRCRAGAGRGWGPAGPGRCGAGGRCSRSHRVLPHGNRVFRVGRGPRASCSSASGPAQHPKNDTMCQRALFVATALGSCSSAQTPSG